MNAYTFATILILVVGLIAVSFQFLNQGRRTINGVAEQPTKIVETVTTAAAAVMQPLSSGVGEICHAIAGRIETKRAELDDQRAKITSLTQEVERLRNRQIRVDQIQPIFQLALFESDLSLRDFVKEVVKTTQGGTINRKEEIEYFGVYRARSIQRFGVDLKRISFRIMPSSVIEVSGLGRTELIGNLKTEVKPEHTELRRHLTGGRLSESHEILEEDLENLLLTRDRKQRDDVHEAITQTRTIDQIDQAVEKMALQFLNDHFLPRGYRVVKAVEEISDGKSIFQLSDEINGHLDEEIAAKSHLLDQAVQKKSELDQDLRSEIQMLKEMPLNV